MVFRLGITMESENIDAVAKVGVLEIGLAPFDYGLLT